MYTLQVEERKLIYAVSAKNQRPGTPRDGAPFLCSFGFGMSLDGSVLSRVMLGGFLGMVCCVDVMPVRHMGMMAGLVVVACFVVLGRRFVVLGGEFMMMCCLEVMISALFRHRNLPGPEMDAVRPDPAIRLCGERYVDVAVR
jgi:hypothetical protein